LSSRVPEPLSREELLALLAACDEALAATDQGLVEVVGWACDLGSCQGHCVVGGPVR